jgi:uncharacterized protein with GYD domain
MSNREYWTLGHYDIVITVAAPDTQTVATLCASVSALGNVRTETLAAFDETEMAEILKKAT